MSGNLALRLGAFGALAVYAIGHWGGLVADGPAGRMALVAVIATAAGGLVAASRALPGSAGTSARLAVTLGAFAAGFLAVGLEARLLLPGNWDELREGVDQGLAGLRTVDWPYDGSDGWVRQVLLLGAPAGGVSAALLAFWPVRRGGAAVRAAGLVLVLVLFGVAVTEREYGAEVVRGAGLALLVAFALWAPRARRREAALATALVVATTAVAVPVAVALDRDGPWIEYRDWNWFGTIDGSAFEWNHSYGPIDWSRDGTTLLRVEADRPLYWKAEVLDRFDGLRWLRSTEDARTAPGHEFPPAPNPEWVEHAQFSVRELRSDLAVVAGVPLRVDGLGGADIASDGTTTLRGRQLREGDSYEVTAYVPNPSRRDLRAAPPARGVALRRYLRIELPPENLPEPGSDKRRPAPQPPVTVAMPFRGDAQPRDLAATEDLLRSSAYARTFALAQRLTSGAPTTYDAVKAVERHLLASYTYTERPPERAYPLEAFLFRDRAGYCQQFSGAMALMLRMAGIPARVVGGFAPGSYNRETGDFRVRDLDAHSWVEVFFAGLGWVQFDPTPSGAPAQSRAEPEVAASSATGTTDPRGGEAVAADRRREPERPPASGAGGDATPLWAFPAILAGLLALAVAALWLLALVRARRSAGRADAALDELVRALRRLGYPLAPQTTLLALEERLGRAAGPGSAAYVRALRHARYANGGPPPPAGGRRALRTELGRNAGRLGRVRSLAALPPQPPFRRD